MTPEQQQSAQELLPYLALVVGDTPGEQITVDDVAEALRLRQESDLRWLREANADWHRWGDQIARLAVGTWGEFRLEALTDAAYR